MLRGSMVAGALLLGVAAASAAPTIEVLPVTGHNRDWMNMAEATNNRPTWDGTKPVSTDTSATAEISAYAGRWAYLDFGPDYADLRITEVWTRYRNWSTGDVRCFQQYGWATNWDTWNIPTLIPETQIKLSSLAALPYANDPQWVRDVDLNASPITPAGRYLFVQAMDPASTNLRATEFAFIGHVAEVPEPGSIAVLAVSGMLLVKRRRAS